MKTDHQDDDFESVWDVVSSWNGWLRESQGRDLFRAARSVRPNGVIVEIGSFQGKSLAVMASAADSSVAVVAIDPHAGNDRGPGEWTGEVLAAENDFQIFHQNLASLSLDARVLHKRDFSYVARKEFDKAIDLLYVDGAHGFRAASNDLESWGALVADGGRMFIHDVFNSVWVTLAVFVKLGLSPIWMIESRSGSLLGLRRTKLPVAKRVLKILRLVLTTPVLVRALLVRGLRRFGLERLGIVVGHRVGNGLY